MFQLGTVDVVVGAVLVLLGLSLVPVLHRTVVSRNPAVNLRLGSADRAGEMLAGQVSVGLTDGVSGRHGVVGQLVILRNGAYQVGGRLPVGQLLTQERVEHRAGGVQGLQFILDVQGVEHIRGVVHRQMGTVGIVGRIPLGPGGDDVGIMLLVVLGQAVGGGLSRGRLQVVQVAVHLLVIGQALTHMV